MRIGAHPGAARPYLASPPPPPPTIDYMMYGVCDMVSYLNNFFTEDKTMTRTEFSHTVDRLGEEGVSLLRCYAELLKISHMTQAQPAPVHQDNRKD